MSIGKSKRSHKLRGLGDAGAVVAAASSMAEAAKQLGVERSTIWRWVKAGKVPPPGGSAPAPVAAAVLRGEQTPEGWATDVRKVRTLTATEDALLELAIKALHLAVEHVHPMVQLSAMTRFQALVKQLRLDGAEAEQPEAEPERVKMPPRRVTHDPRKILQAVK